MPSVSERAMVRSGFFISPEAQVAYSQPSYAQNTAMNATPADAKNGYSPPDNAAGAGFTRKFPQWPFPRVKPKSTNVATAPYLSQVATFCRITALRNPSTLITVRTAMQVTATPSPRVNFHTFDLM